jgi:hypothetical protein
MLERIAKLVLRRLVEAWLLILAGLLVMSGAAVVPQPAVAQHAVNAPHESTTQDLSQGASFTVTIDSGSPKLTFKIVPKVQPNDEFGNAQSTVRDIEVFSGDSGEPLQHLAGCEWIDMEAPPRGEDWFRTVDFNFDGYLDIYVLTNWGATGNSQGCIWIYNPAAKRFDYSAEFSDLGTFTLDPAHKTIITWANGGMAGAVHSAEKYKVQGNRPMLVYLETQEWDQEKKQFHCTVKELRGSEMVATHDEWGKNADNSGPAPCEHSSRIF